MATRETVPCGQSREANAVKYITTREQLIDLARDLRVRPSWHEPDEQNVTARVRGKEFDNAGFWGENDGELCVILSVGSQHCDECGKPEVTEDVAIVNLATLFAWATGHQDER